jgi:hypothetical protein
MKSNPASDEEVDNESVVNAFFITLLKEVGSLVPKVRSKWIMDRIRFKTKFGRGGCIAVTDGALSTNQTCAIQSIVEVKRLARPSILDSVRMQEGNQVSAWCLQESLELPNLNGR